MTWDDLTSRPRPAADAVIAYGDDAMQKVDVWIPAGIGPFPTVLMVHGGCWQTSIADRSLMDWIAGDLRDDGYAVWNIDYRGVDRLGGGYPGTFLDAARAADALRDHAGRFRLGSDRIVAVGHSAGGHLALWLAARRNLPDASPLACDDPIRIDHVVALGALPDLEAVAASPDNGCGTEVVERLVGPATAVHADPYGDTSVARLLPLGVPQDLLNGREDGIVPLRLGTAYAEKARAVGDETALHVIDDTGHVELVAPETAAWAEAKRLIAAAFA